MIKWESRAKVQENILDKCVETIDQLPKVREDKFLPW